MNHNTTLLKQRLEQLAKEDKYHLLKVFKENSWERTELVGDAAGTFYVRKFLSKADDQGILYRHLIGVQSEYFPRIISYESFEENDVVVMEYLQGQTLREQVETQGIFTRAEADHVVRGLCAAASFLHTQSGAPIIHRDINPNNIIYNDGQLKLIDFGIARRYNSDANQDTHIWGTVGYAPPEQFGFGQSDERTDVYAIGMVYYFLLSGRDPGPDFQSKLASMSAIDSGAKGIIARCTALDPAKRIKSATALGFAVAADKTIALKRLCHRMRPLWFVWCALLTTCFVLISGMLVVNLFNPAYADMPQELALETVQVASALLFMFVPSLLFLTNIGHWVGHVPWLQRKQAIKIAGILIACFILAMLGIGIPEGMHSVDYLTLRSRN